MKFASFRAGSPEELQRFQKLCGMDSIVSMDEFPVADTAEIDVEIRMTKHLDFRLIETAFRVGSDSMLFDTLKMQRLSVSALAGPDRDLAMVIAKEAIERARTSSAIGGAQCASAPPMCRRHFTTDNAMDDKDNQPAKPHEASTANPYGLTVGETADAVDRIGMLLLTAIAVWAATGQAVPGSPSSALCAISASRLTRRAPERTRKGGLSDQQVRARPVPAGCRKRIQEVKKLVLSLLLATLAFGALSGRAAESSAPKYGLVACKPGEEKALLVVEYGGEFRSFHRDDVYLCGPKGWYRTEKGLRARLHEHMAALPYTMSWPTILQVIPLDQ